MKRSLAEMIEYSVRCKIEDEEETLQELIADYIDANLDLADVLENYFQNNIDLENIALDMMSE